MPKSNVVRLPQAAKSSLPADTDAAILRFRQIAADSAEHEVLSDGPVSPDAPLLDICAQALHRVSQAEKLLFKAPRPRGDGWTDEEREEFYKAVTRYHSDIRAVKVLMRRLGKIRASTAAGIFGKALVVRGSKTGAQCLAKSLAEDLIACPGLRVSLWPAVEGGAK